MRSLANLNWLLVLLLSWAIPVLWPQSYLFSLLFWLLPIGVLLPDFMAATDTPTRRRRWALVYSAGWIVALGVTLDFVFGRQVLTFNASWYLFRIRGVPVEEILFYVLAPTAILLVYAWCDEIWLNAYNQSPVRDRVLANQPPLLVLSWPIALWAVVFRLAAVVTKRVTHAEWALPTYAAFLIGTAFLPAAATYRAVHQFVNWRAFGATALYAIATSLVYEVTLAIPLEWWGYRVPATVGVLIESWSRPDRPFPLEAAIVWVAAPFSCVLTYEFAKAYLHHPDLASRTRLFGR